MSIIFTKSASTNAVIDQYSLHERAQIIEDVLNFEYGAPFEFFSDKDPLSTLVSAILSHRTKNAVSRRAYLSLTAAFPTWEAVIAAPLEDITVAIRVATFAEVKAPRIQEALRLVRERNHGNLSLAFLSQMSVSAARQWVEKIPGVGAKTSAAILNFSSLRMPALVVDTHHQRVAQRLGLVPPKATIEKAAKILQNYLPTDYVGQQVYDNHQGLMRHGQRVCHWQKPECERCVVRTLCEFYQFKQK